MSSKALFIHVPVDKVEIVNGPGPTLLVRLVAGLYARLAVPHASGTVWIDADFTLRTAASSSTFRRRLKITAFDLADVRLDDFGDLDRNCSFTARFDGHIVSGYYNPKRRTGHFHYFD